MGCHDVCDCNTSCCLGFKIPLVPGYVICGIWISLNGATFPVMSWLFWPKSCILYVTYCICFLIASLGFLYLINTCLKNVKVFKVVLYGVTVVYVCGGFTIMLILHLDLDGSRKLLRDSMKKKFNISIDAKESQRVLQASQIFFFIYLFISYLYCGFILQVYEMKCRYRIRVSWCRCHKMSNKSIETGNESVE